jgi:hypothetical protein
MGALTSAGVMLDALVVDGSQGCWRTLTMLLASRPRGKKVFLTAALLPVVISRQHPISPISSGGRTLRGSSQPLGGRLSREREAYLFDL